MTHPDLRDRTEHQIKEMGYKLRFGFPLSVADQRWLWDGLYGFSPPLVRRRRCWNCRGEGKDRTIISLDQVCPYCRGEGYEELRDFTS